MNLFNLIVWLQFTIPSQNFQAGLCSAYVRIVNACPPYSWRPECLLSLLCSLKSNFHLVDCFRVAVSRLGPDVVGRKMTGDNSTDLYLDHECSNVGGKRPIQDPVTSETKRQKIDDCSDSKCQEICKFVNGVTGVGEKEYADFMCTSLNLLLQFLKPPEDSNFLRTEIALRAICTLCIVFSEHPHAELSLCIFQRMFKWISWMSQQVCLFNFIFLI